MGSFRGRFEVALRWPGRFEVALTPVFCGGAPPCQTYRAGMLGGLGRRGCKGGRVFSESFS